ncbi:MAG: hypothetical protein NVSMB32_09350 [Actinomycetota bacterium]
MQLRQGADLPTVLAAVQGFHGVSAALPVGFAESSGLAATTGGSTQQTGGGLVLGIPDTYRATFPGEIRRLNGTPTGVLITQQAAANLHVAPGDSVSIGRADLPAATVTVDAIVDLPHADSLFQKVGAPAGSQPLAPPDNVMLVPEGRWHQLFDPLAGAHPELAYAQIHTRLDLALPADPAAAFTQASATARNLEVKLAGDAQVGDNLAATLAAARSDSLYAQALFLFLGLPGAVIAGLLTAAVAGAGADRRRREQALLRTRGATTTQLVRLGLAEAATVGGTGALLGLGAAAVIGRVAFGTWRFGATTGASIGWGLGAVCVGLLIAAAAIALPAWRDARGRTVANARLTAGRARSPRWARFGLDLWLLAGSATVFWLTSRNGYTLVLAPEGVPTITVNYWALAGPLLLWAGAGLLAWRLADLALSRGRRMLAAATMPLAGRLAGTVASTMSRQRRLVTRGVVLVALTLSFALSTAVFNSTYRQQAEADARLTNGGDVTVIQPPGSAAGPGATSQLAGLPGVRHVEPLVHRFAYVGNDLQDLYGVNPDSVVAAGKLQDGYFQGGSASQLMARLKAQPDGVLVSAETVKDYQLLPGDTLKLRLPDARTHQLVPVPFHYVGIAKEFPTAPKDSFLLANAPYVAQQTGSDAVGTFLIDTGSASPSTVANRVRGIVEAGAVVTDIQTTRQVVGSSLTAVDLAGLTRVELGFALLLGAAATGLVLALGHAERRQTLAIAAALGAKPRQLGGFVWSEALFVTLGGGLAGIVAGWALSQALVKVLTGVFDPPPSALAVPWAYLAAVGAAAMAATGVAGMAAIARARRPALEVLRESP